MILRIFFSILIMTVAAWASPDLLILPTANDHLFRGKPENFYTYVDRTFEGETSKPWDGGMFGFVRTPIRVNGEIVLTKFHEGIDISPLQRDQAGNPLDPVNSIAEGIVVHINPVAGNSNYGKYVVIEHIWDDCPVYSLYAHLSDISCKVGDSLKAGERLGTLGFTGAGINRARAHLHLEIALKLSERFDDWNAFQKGSRNLHGNYNGQNLAGVDVAQFYLERLKTPNLSFKEFVASTPVHFKVTVPSTGVIPEFARRYRWLLRGDAAKAKSWEFAFSATGQPISVTASERIVNSPTLTYLVNASLPHRYLTRDLVVGENGHAKLSRGGLKLISLVSDAFPVASATPAAPDPSKKPRPASSRNTRRD